MIKGIGLDIVEIKRIESIYNRNKNFAKRILTEEEIHIFTSLQHKRKIEFLAGRFSAKEAFSKALGCGIGGKLSFQDLSVLNDEAGKPYIQTKKNKNSLIHLSITHTREYAAAQVIIEEVGIHFSTTT